MGAVMGVIVFKTISTLDSMVGYRSPEYLYFGRAAARLDDTLNFIPARLSVPVLTLAAGLCGLDARGCLRTALRDRSKHASPNAGHAESCATGALGVRLGGPTRYPFGPVEKPWLGDGDWDVSSVHIDRTCALVLCSGLIALGAAVLICHALGSI
jgi:adenosylcobinamide-phosphate synthase